jgi:hypothetical protein
MAIVKIKFLSGIASASWSFEAGEIVAMPEEKAQDYLGMGIAQIVEAQRCPHCKKVITPPEGDLEAATMASEPRRRG